MKVAKQVVSYYHEVTGNPWSDFYDKLDIAMSDDLSTQTDEMWLIHSLMNVVIKHGMSVNEFKINKDAVKAVFDEDSRKQNGEFFTPEVWAVEARKYFDKYIPNWHEYNVWETSCYDIQTKVLIRRKKNFKTLGDGLRYLRNIATNNGCKRDDIDLIAFGDKDELSRCNFNRLDYAYSDGYTLIARVSPHLLEKSDEILTRHPDTGEIEWCGYHNLFFKKSSRMIKFYFGNNHFYFKKYLKVTPDHQMYIRFNSDTVYTSITAEELCNKLSTESCYIMLREGTEVKVDDFEVFDIERDVWDLTTNNDSHCFCVSPSDDIDLFCGNCGSGNLVRSMGHNPDKLFMSTLQEDDVRMVQNTPEFAGANVFQCDFLSGIDYDEYNTQFLDKLPERLQQIIKNDEPLIIFSNPPYKTGMASATEVGRYMKESSTPEIDMAKPAYDIFYQFCWRYMKFVEMFNLTNCYCGFFGPLTFFTGAGANILLSEFEHYYDFIDGMCISAQEFSDTSDSILWGIGFSLWKSTGSDYNNFNRRDILLEKKYLLPDGSVGSKGRVLYEPPREKLSDWVAPKDVNMDITAPLATSHLTFKGSEVFEKVAPKSGKMASNALGTLMIGNTLTRSADQSAILSVPSTIMYTSITEENFWRCVASYAFRRIYDASWAVTKKEISAPNTNVEGYQQWLYNAIPLVLFEYKSMMASMRDVVWEGAKTDIRNHLFYLDEATVRQYCTDPVILKDLEEHPPCNQFMLNIIEQTKPYWSPEVKQLYDWCVNYTLATYDRRKEVGYKGSLECWDAGFQQIRSACWDDSLNDELTKILVTARDFMKRDVDKFGFVSDADGEDL